MNTTTPRPPFLTALNTQNALMRCVDNASLALQPFARCGGLVPDYVKDTGDYQQAKRAYDKAHHNLREHNSWFCKLYKKELAVSRGMRRK